MEAQNQKYETINQQLESQILNNKSEILNLKYKIPHQQSTEIQNLQSENLNTQPGVIQKQKSKLGM